MIAEADLQKKIKNVLEELPYEKLIDIHNKVLKAFGVETVTGYIFKADSKVIDKVFEGWEPSLVLECLGGSSRDWVNAEYFAYSDMYGWRTWVDAREAFEKCEDIDYLAVVIKSKCIRCGVPEIDRLLHKTEG